MDRLKQISTARYPREAWEAAVVMANVKQLGNRVVAVTAELRIRREQAQECTSI